MTHHHNHDHAHDHNHTHDHNHDKPVSEKEKIVKILDHWIKHNTDHVKNYKDWAKRAKDIDLPEVATLLEELAEASLNMNDKFKQALELAQK